METPPRRPCVSPPPHPTNTTDCPSPRPLPLLPPQPPPEAPLSRVHQELVSIRRRVRGPTYSTGSVTDNRSSLFLSLVLCLSLFLLLCGRVSSTFATERSTSRSLATRDPRDPPLEDESQCIELRTERYFGSIERDTGLYGGVYF